MLKLVIIVFIPDRDQNRDRKVLTEDQEARDTSYSHMALHLSTVSLLGFFHRILNVKSQLVQYIVTGALVDKCLLAR